MTIEVKQLLVKSSVQSETGGHAERSVPSTVDCEALKENVIVECRKLIVELLREKQER